uniref:Lipid scramblase CLPTM1L n=1 Tax=Panstrongylus lignarius TaxID=156445 RepID=A0A224XN19_9HEMI
MWLPSLSFICSSFFIIYVGHSIFSLARLFFLPACEPGERCIKYYLHHKPKLKLVTYASVNPIPKTIRDQLYIGEISPFSYTEEFEKVLNIKLPEKTVKNGTLFFHLFILDESVNLKKWNDLVSWRDHVYTRLPITSFQIPKMSTFDLLKGGESHMFQVPVTHIKKEIGFNVLTGVKEFPAKEIPVELYRLVKEAQDGSILPLLYYDFLNDRIDHLEQITQETPLNFQIRLKYTPINIGKLRLMIHTEAALKSLKMYGVSDKDMDQLKGVFADTNIYLLVVTLFVSSVHLLFDFLALKNDVKFWRSRTTLAGLSLRSVLWRAFSQTVIVMYLFDEEASILVLGPAVVSGIIEFWKVQKVIPVDWKKMKLKKVQLTAEEKMTRLIDAEGMKYLSYILYPLCIAGAIYSLFYQQYKSWYSWLIHSLVNGVYAFGFLFMLPQLFINYKLKSVAHLPWKSFMYKAFNTFIDDLFAFIITMPTAHRLACFRDDVIFIIYLYQRWLYPVDKSRIDESSHLKIE